MVARCAAQLDRDKQPRLFYQTYYGTHDTLLISKSSQKRDRVTNRNSMYQMRVYLWHRYDCRSARRDIYREIYIYIYITISLCSWIPL